MYFYSNVGDFYLEEWCNGEFDIRNDIKWWVLLYMCVCVCIYI